MTDNIIPMPEPLDKIIKRIRDAYARIQQGRHELIDGTIDLALALKDGRGRFKSDRDFSHWLIDSDLDFINKDDRAALIKMAEHVEITRIVLQETERTSWRWIWSEEIEPRLAIVAIPAPLPPDLQQNLPNSPAETESASPKNATIDHPGFQSDTKAHRGRASPIKDLPNGDLVLSYVQSRKTKTHLAELYNSKKKYRPIWHLLVTSVEQGHYGEPNSINSETTNLSLILPWIDSRNPFARRNDLAEPHVQKLVTDVIFPLLRQKPELKADVYRFEREVNTRRVELEDQTRRQLKLERHRTQLETIPLPANERPVIAYGVPLWPPLGDLTPRYTYDELCHACWYSMYFLDLQINRAWRPPETAMAARHLTKYVEDLQPGFVRAVRDIFNAYEEQPNGETKFPSPPVNNQWRK